MIRTRLARSVLFVALAVAAVSCGTVGRDYEAPVPAVPAAFREAGSGGLQPQADGLTAWWRRLDDRVLDSLIERAVHDGLDLKAAMARVDEARALRGLAATELWPRVDAQAGYRRLGQSENTPLGAFATNYDQYTAGFDASWEVDLWGRVRRSVEAADADLSASLETARAAAVTVVAETAASYVELRALQQRLAIARNNQALQQQTLELVRSRLESGLVGERDVAQAKSNLAATRARVPSLEIALRAAENRLTVLLGLAPGALAEELRTVQPVPLPPAAVDVGVPADAVRRRPDVRAAERALAAETSRIGVAEGDLYPRLSLLGSVGLESDHASNLFDARSSVFSIGPSITWNLFDSGRVHRRIDAQDARARQALVQWRQTVLRALEEAENAMAAYVREQTRRDQLAESAAEARRAVALAEAQYREGLTDFQNVLDSERALTELEDQEAQSGAAVTEHLIGVYKALGGGWETATGGSGSRP